MPELTTSTLILLALALAAAGLLGYGSVVAWRKLHRSPRMVFRRIGHRRLSDLVLPDGMDGEIHVDHLVLTDRGLLVLELRNASGALFGGESLDQWRVMDGVRRFTFRNPLPGLEARVHSVELLAGEVPVEGRVAFVGDIVFAAGRPSGIATLTEVAAEFQRDSRAEGGPATPDAWLEAWKRISEAARGASES
jgi:hypothetical protein